jgi:hypothetical protein
MKKGLFKGLFKRLMQINKKKNTCTTCRFFKGEFWEKTPMLDNNIGIGVWYQKGKNHRNCKPAMYNINPEGKK